MKLSPVAACRGFISSRLSCMQRRGSGRAGLLLSFSSPLKGALGASPQFATGSTTHGRTGSPTTVASRKRRPAFAALAGQREPSGSALCRIYRCVSGLCRGHKRAPEAHGRQDLAVFPRGLPAGPYLQAVGAGTDRFRAIPAQVRSRPLLPKPDCRPPLRGFRLRCGSPQAAHARPLFAPSQRSCALPSMMQAATHRDRRLSAAHPHRVAAARARRDAARRSW